MLTVSELYIYPIKSLGGIALNYSKLTSRGFQNDRRWMLIDNNNRFVTQREFPAMALLQVQLAIDGLQVRYKKNERETLFIPFQSQNNERLTVEIWENKCAAKSVSTKANKWFSKMLKTECRLVYMPDSTNLKVDGRYALNGELTSFSDGYPMLIIGQSSLDDLNSKLEEPLPMDRFRPNIVFTGGDPYEEDSMEHFTINGINFFGVKLSARCVIITTNQEDATQSKEPLKTLAAYRSMNNKVYFGQNLLHEEEGEIRIGDTIEIITRKKSLFETLSS